jgi:hypothetical protein
MDERRVGVTGHRALAEPDDVRRRVDAVLDTIDAPLTGVSSLAEGADRLVAQAVLDRGGRLAVVLPLDAADYETDFADAASRAEFRRLLDAATAVTTMPPAATREDAYAAAGAAMLAGCDVLLALWDGEPGRGRGGTAEVVAAARAGGRRVEVVTVTRAVPC